MVSNPIILLVSILLSLFGFQSSNSAITGKSVGEVYLGMPLDEFVTCVKSYNIIIDEDYGYLLYDKKELVLRVWSKDQKRVSGISVYSPKFVMGNGLRVGSRTDEVLEKVKDFTLGINDLDTEEGYILPLGFNQFDKILQDKIVFKLIVKPIKGKYVGDYKTFQPNEGVKKLKNKGIIKAIEMYTFN